MTERETKGSAPLNEEGFQDFESQNEIPSPKHIDESDPHSNERPAGIMVNAPVSKPIVVYVIMGLTILMYIAQSISMFQFGKDYVLALLAKINEAIIAGQYWRLVSAVLVHGGFMHIAFNMYALFILGRSVESIYGHERFIMLYLLGAFGGNVLSFAFSGNPSVGASTALFAIIAAQAIFIFKNRHIFLEQWRGMLSQIVLILILNLLISIAPGSRIDLWGHLGGLLAGTVFSIIASPVLSLAKHEDRRVVLVDASSRFDRYLGFAMVLLAFGVIVFLTIRRAMPL